MRVDRLDVDRGKPAGPQHLGQRPGVALVALDPSAFDGVRRAARVHADHRIADRFKRPEQVRREWATLKPDLIQGSLEPMQGAIDHFRMRIDGSSPHRLARPIDHADRRSLAADIQPWDCHENLASAERKSEGTWLEFKPRSLPANSARLRLGGRGACCGKQDGVGR